MHLFSRSLSLTLLLICLSSTTSYSLHEYLYTNYDKTRSTNKGLSWSHFRNKYLLAIASVLIGATTGGLTKYFENQLGLNILGEVNIFTLLWIIFAWHFESDIRNMTIESVRQDLNYSNQEHHTNLLSIYARIASWTTYITMSNMPTHLKTLR